MGWKSNVLIGGMALAGIGLGAGALLFAYMNQPEHDVQGEALDVDLANIASYEVDEDAGDIAVMLEHEMVGGNTLITWTCGKLMAGERVEYHGTWSVMSGGVVYTAATEESDGQLKALELNFVLESFTGYGSEHPAPAALTNTVLGINTPAGAWFDWKTYPDAIFTATTFTPREEADEANVPENAPEGWTHLIEGQFTFNSDEAKTEHIAAVVNIEGDTLTIDSAFVLSTEKYGFLTPNTPYEVDDFVDIHGHIEAAPNQAGAMQVLGETINDLEGRIGVLEEQNNNYALLIENMTAEIAQLQGDLELAMASGMSAQPEIDESSLEQTLTITDPQTLQEFEFVLVPGDPEQGIDPFYMMVNEVSWDQFRTWSHGDDISGDAEHAAQLRSAELRPSPPFGDMSEEMGFGSQPALRMSRLSAQRFCEYISAASGYTVRLPTDKEWDYAFTLGGGDLDATAPLPDAEDYAFLETTDEGWQSWPVDEGKLNDIGVRNMLGNVAEWVTDTGTERVVRGGSMNHSADEVTGAWREAEDQNVWNARYPNNPKSKWWYVDAFWIGFRMVADVTPPKDVDGTPPSDL